MYARHGPLLRSSSVLCPEQRLLGVLDENKSSLGQGAVLCLFETLGGGGRGAAGRQEGVGCICCVFAVYVLVESWKV